MRGSPALRRRRLSGQHPALLRVAVFMQYADLTVLHRLLDWTASGGDTPPEGLGGSMN